MLPSPAVLNLFFTAPDEGGISQMTFLHPDIHSWMIEVCNFEMHSASFQLNT